MAYSAHHKDKTPFYKTVEDTYGAFAAYYDTPYLSMRNAIWRLSEHHHYQMNFTHYYGLSYDFVHPLEQGHRLIADMVLFAMQQAYIDLLMSPWSKWDEEEVTAALPKPMYYGETLHNYHVILANLDRRSPRWQPHLCFIKRHCLAHYAVGAQESPLYAWMQ
jgi:hypothetical protein